MNGTVLPQSRFCSYREFHYLSQSHYFSFQFHLTSSFLLNQSLKKKQSPSPYVHLNQINVFKSTNKKYLNCFLAKEVPRSLHLFVYFIKFVSFDTQFVHSTIENPSETEIFRCILVNSHSPSFSGFLLD